MSESPLLLSFLDPSLYFPLHAMNDVQILLVDGYISRTFRSQAAEQYFLNLLKSSFIPPQTSSIPAHQVVGYLTAASRTGGQWSLGRFADASIFEGEGGDLGIPLAASTNSRSHNLQDASYLAPLGQNSSTYIRIVVSNAMIVARLQGVQAPSSDISRDSISIAGFARQIGRTVDTFLQVCELDPESDADQRDLWRIWGGGIRGSDIVIIGAVQVSTGSWMPIIQLDRYNF
ncbi:hypothetical protein EDB87DRAFT_1573392 [Lactarius vividus]|nr:hypothetical protein EDB87DRAFT_1573392 [Lactarius vividus]